MRYSFHALSKGGPGASRVVSNSDENRGLLAGTKGVEYRNALRRLILSFSCACERLTILLTTGINSCID